MCIILIIALLIQEDPSKLIDTLHSTDLLEREEAAQKLKGLGKRALPALQKAAEDSDRQVRAWARSLLDYLALCDQLTPSLRSAFPGIEDRIFNANDETWTALFLRAETNPALRKKDLEILAPRAVRGARGFQTKREVCLIIGRWGFRTAVPELVRLLEDSDPNTRSIAERTIEAMSEASAAGALLKTLDRNADPDAIAALAKLRHLDAISKIRACLKNPSVLVRQAAAEALGKLGATEAIPDLIDLLDDERVQTDVLDALGRLTPSGDLGGRWARHDGGGTARSSGRRRLVRLADGRFNPRT